MRNRRVYTAGEHTRAVLSPLCNTKQCCPVAQHRAVAGLVHRAGAGLTPGGINAVHIFQHQEVSTGCTSSNTPGIAGSTLLTPGYSREYSPHTRRYQRWCTLSHTRRYQRWCTLSHPGL